MKRVQFAVRRGVLIRAVMICFYILSAAARAHLARAAVLYSNDTPNTSMAAASRPANGNFAEIEAADDFQFANTSRIDGATFTGLLPTGAPLSNVTGVAVEIYRVFPLDSTNPPDNAVPTRNNSPSDNALTGRDSAVAGQLTFSSAILNPNFTAANSVLNGINKSLTPATGGEGPVSGEEVQFTLTFPGGITLPANHYFFKPEAGLAVAPSRPSLRGLRSAASPRWAPPARTASTTSSAKCRTRSSPSSTPRWT